MKFQKKKHYKKNIKFILYFLLCLGIPFAILPIFVPAYQLWTPQYATSAVDLFLSAYGLEATILFAVLIYKLQKADAEKEHTKRLSYAKTAMATALQSGIRWTFKPRWEGYPGLAFTAKDIFLEYMTELQELLEREQYEFLVLAVETIDAAVREDERHSRPDTSLFIKPALWLLSHSKFFPLFENVWNEQVFLNSETIDLLEALGVEIEEFEELKFGFINDMDGNVLFSVGNFRGEYGVYHNREVLFKGVLVEDYDGHAIIWDGYEKSKEYVGNYSEGKFHGEGCEYDWHGEKYREGIFHAGEHPVQLLLRLLGEIAFLQKHQCASVL